MGRAFEAWPGDARHTCKPGAACGAPLLMPAPLVGTVHPLGSRGQYLYVTIIARHRGGLLLCRHSARQSWEQPGGHIEPGETPLAAAKRELYEETGAKSYRLWPVVDYSAGGTHGMLFFAQVESLGPLPKSEMAEVQVFEALPANLTYPRITPVLLRRVEAWLAAHGMPALLALPEQTQA